MSEGKYSSRLKILILMPYVHSGIFPSIVTNNFEECIKILINTIFYLFVHFKDFIYLFLERGRVGEREGEKHQCVVASHVPPTRDLTRNQACVLTGNQTSNPLIHRPALNPLSHTSQG